MEFFCVDVETANESNASICQLGIAGFAEGRYIDGFQSLVDPDDVFLDVNVGIHGIGPDAIIGAPRFASLYPILLELLSEKIVITHTPFDRVSLNRACEAAGLSPIPCRWLDSARVVRRAFPNERYGLRHIARHLGIQFTHHDALEDARCAGEVLLRAISETNIDLNDWFRRVEQPIFGDPAAFEANEEGPLYGEVLVFTGELSITRSEAAKLAAKAGCEVCDGVTKHTTILVVGNQDARRLHGADISSKHAKARKLVEQGKSLRIISESDFESLVSLN